MAHVEKRGDRWRARYRGPDGKERSKTFDKKGDATKFLTSAEGSKLTGEWIDPRLGKMPLSEWAEQWLAGRIALKPKTRYGYESLLRTRLLPEFGRYPLVELRPVQIQQWVAQLHAAGVSASQVRQSYRLLSTILKGAVDSGYLAKTPCVAVNLPRVKPREMLFLSAAQVDDLAEAAASQPLGENFRNGNATLIYLLAYGGLRWGEAAAVRRGRCDLLRSRVHVAEALSDVSGVLHWGETKTRETRQVVLPRFLCEMLARHLENVPADPSALVFTAPDGGAMRHANWRNRVWVPSVAAAGLPAGLRIHDLRHTAASLLIAQGAHPKAISSHLGHSSISVTVDRYGHLFDSDMDSLAERLDAARANVSRPDRGLAGVPNGTGEVAHLR